MFASTSRAAPRWPGSCSISTTPPAAGDFAADAFCLIGGGDIMAESGRVLRDRGRRVRAILAPRHASEPLAYAPGTLAERLDALRIPHLTIDDINAGAWSAEDWAGPRTLAMCFGPSWVFSAEVIARFGAGMVNVNPIPVPRYLGGAHYSWQLLHGDRDGGCFIQEITTRVDRGDVLLSHRFRVPDDATRPADYFRANFDEARRCVERFLDRLEAGGAVERVRYETLEADRLYFPRLMTIEQAYLDWSWTADEIKRFCDAFDDPYAGAMTFLDGTRLHLKGIAIEAGDRFHPFTAGLIVRRLGSEVVVAARDAALRLGTVVDDDGRRIEDTLREGGRFHTPRELLDRAVRYRPRLSSKGFIPQ